MGWHISTPARSPPGDGLPRDGGLDRGNPSGCGAEGAQGTAENKLAFFTSVPCDWRHLPSQGGVLPGKAEEDLKILSLLPFFSDTLLSDSDFFLLS